MVEELALGYRAKRGSERCAEAKPEGYPQSDIAECRAKRDAICEAHAGPDGQAAPGLFILVFRRSIVCFSVFFVVHYFPFACPSLPPLGQALLCLEDAFDEPQQKWVGRLGHLAVIVAVQLHDRRFRVADNLHHAPEIRVFLVAAEHLQLAIAGDQ